MKRNLRSFGKPPTKKQKNPQQTMTTFGIERIHVFSSGSHAMKVVCIEKNKLITINDKERRQEIVLFLPCTSDI